VHLLDWALHAHLVRQRHVAQGRTARTAASLVRVCIARPSLQWRCACTRRPALVTDSTRYGSLNAFRVCTECAYTAYGVCTECAYTACRVCTGADRAPPARAAATSTGPAPHAKPSNPPTSATAAGPSRQRRVHGRHRRPRGRTPRTRTRARARAHTHTHTHTHTLAGAL
jgi:hypothetical protein